MWKLAHTDQLHGESGYFLTVFESAIDFIINYDSIEYDKYRNNNNSMEKSSVFIRPSLMNRFSNFSFNSLTLRFSFDNDNH
jgi:hypothetical protein